MRKLIYFIFLRPLIWVLELIGDWKEFGFKHGIWIPFKDNVESFFWEYHHNGIFGPGGSSWRTFKSGNLALLISILLVITFIIYIFVV